MATITQNREFFITGEYDTIICGGGLFGIIAALAAARTSGKTVAQANEKAGGQTSERAVAQTRGKVVVQTSDRSGVQINEKHACMGISQAAGTVAARTSGKVVVQTSEKAAAQTKEKTFEINKPKSGYKDIKEISRNTPRLSGSFGGFVRLLVKS